MTLFSARRRKHRLMVSGLVLGGILLIGVSLLTAENEDEPRVQAATHSPTPRREPPAGRFDYRGEHAGVVRLPESSVATDSGAIAEVGLAGRRFVTRRGLSVFVPIENTGPSVTDPVVLGASYEVVRPGQAQPADATSEADSPSSEASVDIQEVEVPGEFVEVYRPAVYEIDEAGRERLISKEKVERVPKVRVVIWRAAPANARPTTR